MLASPQQLELAKNIKAISNNPLFQTDGDKLVMTAKLFYGQEFDTAAIVLGEYQSAVEDFKVQCGKHPSNNITVYHCSITVCSELSYLSDIIGSLVMTMWRRGEIDRSRSPSGIWALCKMVW